MTGNLRAALGAFIAVGALATASSAGAASSVEYPTPGDFQPSPPTTGPDNNLWLTGGGAIWQLTPAGQYTKFNAGLAATADPVDITTGPDGNLWADDAGDSVTTHILKVTPSGQITPLALPAKVVPSAITAGPNGDLYFYASDQNVPAATPAIPELGRVIPSTGHIDLFPLSSSSLPNFTFEDLTVGSDNNLYITDSGDKGIWKDTPAGVATLNTGGGVMNQPTAITTGSDGNLWFADGQNASVGRLTLSTGAVQEFSAVTGTDPDPQPDDVTLGPDGNVWFTDVNAGQRGVGYVTPAGAVHEFFTGITTGLPSSITVGADNNIWVPQGMDPQQAVTKVTPAGAATAYTGGLHPDGGGDGSEIDTGPDGNLWFNDNYNNPGMSEPYAVVQTQLQEAAQVTSGAASAISSTGAQLAASVNTLGSSTSVLFQYGTSMALGSQTAPVTLPASGTPAPVTAAASALPAGTTIYYRAVASNIYTGASYGQILSFKTAASTSGTSTGTTTSTTTTPTSTKPTLGIRVTAAKVLFTRPKHSKSPLDVIVLHLRSNQTATATLATTLSYKVTKKRTKSYKLSTLKVKLKANRTTTVEVKLSASLRAVLAKHRLSAKFTFKQGKSTKTATATISHN